MRNHVGSLGVIWGSGHGLGGWGGLGGRVFRRISQNPSNLFTAGGSGRIREPDLADAPYDARVRDVLIEALYASGSDLLLLPVQDVFGWRDRINEPATVTGENWTFRLPWPSDRLDEIPEARERQEKLREWAAGYKRL
ncbi:MAG: 4-alpha-glucanotransferase [Acidobacteria bacterium]|nr:4-alpha-glucanotransferase [Acidobacteriota bacterium]